MTSKRMSEYRGERGRAGCVPGEGAVYRDPQEVEEWGSATPQGGESGQREQPVRRLFCRTVSVHEEWPGLLGVPGADEPGGHWDVRSGPMTSGVEAAGAGL